MKLLAVAALVSLTVFVAPAPADSAATSHRPHMASRPNRRAAALAGWALHFTQDARALQRAALRRREKNYGPSDPQVRADRRRLRVIRQKMRYFSGVKRRSEGRSAKNGRHPR